MAVIKCKKSTGDKKVRTHSVVTRRYLLAERILNLLTVRIVYKFSTILFRVALMMMPLLRSGCLTGLWFVRKTWAAIPERKLYGIWMGCSWHDYRIIILQTLPSCCNAFCSGRWSHRQHPWLKIEMKLLALPSNTHQLYSWRYKKCAESLL